MDNTTEPIKKPVRSLDINQVMDAIPHRYPFLMIDRVDIIEEGKTAIGRKSVTINEQFFQGHFPGEPIMPGVLLIIQDAFPDR